MGKAICLVAPDFLYGVPRAAMTNYYKLGGLKQQRPFSLTVLEAGDWNQDASRATFPLKLRRETPSMPLPAAADLCQRDCFQGLHIPRASSLCLSLCNVLLWPLQGRLSLDLGPILIKNDVVSRFLPNLHLHRHLFQIWSHSMVLGGHICWELLFNLMDFQCLPSRTCINLCQIQAFVYRKGSQEMGQMIIILVKSCSLGYFLLNHHGLPALFRWTMLWTQEDVHLTCFLPPNLMQEFGQMASPF